MQVKISNKAYDALMVTAQIILPAVGTLYAALSGIWGLPATEQVLGTIAAVDTFLGGILKVISSGYKPELAGKIVIDDSDPGKTVHQIQINGNPEEVLAGQKQVTFSVEKGVASPLT
jgi:Putative phage holin Dp-1